MVTLLASSTISARNSSSAFATVHIIIRSTACSVYVGRTDDDGCGLRDFAHFFIFLHNLFDSSLSSERQQQVGFYFITSTL